jgi:hypothetical protein
MIQMTITHPPEDTTYVHAQHAPFGPRALSRRGARECVPTTGAS